jgi:hypothetical protein
MTIRLTDKGFGLTSTLLAIVVIVAIGAGGWVVYRHEHKAKPISTVKAAVTTKKQTGSPKKTVTQPANPYAGWKSYTSTVGGLSFQYPSTWSLAEYTEHVGSTPVYDVNLAEPVGSNPNINNFQLSFEIAPSTSSLRPGGQLSNGSTTKLSNGLLAWQENQSANYTCAQGVATCPFLSLATNEGFYAQLASGYYVTATGGFEMGQNNTTTYSYQQQVTSPEWIEGEDILASINI